MKIIRKQLFIFFAIFNIFITNSLAHEYKIGNLKILHPYIIETPQGAKTAGGYMKIVNTGNQTDNLSLVTVDFAKVAEIHEMKTENDVMKMRKIKGGLEIPAKDFTELKHKGYHIMFMNLIKPMIKGETHEGTLYFEKAGNIKVIFAVEKIGFKLEGNN
jgi:copper(I)-binding protein